MQNFRNIANKYVYFFGKDRSRGHEEPSGIGQKLTLPLLTYFTRTYLTTEFAIM